MTATATPIDPTIANWEEEDVHLLGGVCEACDTVTFPQLHACPRCGGQDVSPHRLSSVGTLWTWTTQGFPVKAPYMRADEPFEPYVLGYVELGNVRVEGWLLAEPEDLQIGMPMKLTTFVVPESGDRAAVRTFAFAPVTEQNS